MLDQVSTGTENQSAITDGAAKILSDQSGPSLNDVSRNSPNRPATNSFGGTVLPDVTIQGSDTTAPLIQPDPKYMSDEDGSFGHFMGDCGTVLNIVKDGAWKEITEHPVDLAVTAVEGAAIGVVAALAAPEVLAFATGAAVMYGGMQLWNHLDGWMHDADAVTSPEDYTDSEVAHAHQDLEDAGAGGAHMLAGMAGGFAAKPISMLGDNVLGSFGIGSDSTLDGDAVYDSWIRNQQAASAAGESTTAASGEGSAAASGESATAASAESVTTASGESAAAAPGESATTISGDSATATSGDSAAAAPAESATADSGDSATAAPEDSAAAASVAENQAIFRAAKDENAVVSVTRNPYPVIYEKVGPEGKVMANPLNPEGVQVPEGKWVGTQMTPDGKTPVGLQWSMDNDSLMMHYHATPEELAENNEFVRWTDRSTVPQRMVQLDDGSWLVNGDYNNATGEPGTGFYKIPANTFDQWYKPVEDPSS